MGKEKRISFTSHTDEAEVEVSLAELYSIYKGMKTLIKEKLHLTMKRKKDSVMQSIIWMANNY